MSDGAQVMATGGGDAEGKTKSVKDGLMCGRGLIESGGRTSRLVVAWSR
jgi:hypothetical protein